MMDRINGLDDLLEELNKDILGESGKTKYVGMTVITRRDLEKLRASKKKANIKMVGTLSFAEDVTPDLVRETIESIKIRGRIKAADEVRKVLKELQ